MNAAQHVIILGIRLYRLMLSPAKLFLFGQFGGCRFTPSCSAYALEAVARHGALGGSWLALKRILRCHPWGGCGHDPVPEKLPKIQSPNSKVGTTTTASSGLKISFGRTSSTSPGSTGRRSTSPVPAPLVPFSAE